MSKPSIPTLMFLLISLGFVFYVLKALLVALGAIGQ